ncbi:MAG: dephospho-CoA kinase [Yoonia sp.]|nr:dephospho-CoA kinase [Yoonia sp.]
MTLRVGLTGSIGMGKSTTAAMFADEGIPVWDADRAVHDLYAPNGAAVEIIRAQFPSVINDGAVSRRRLRELIATDPTVLDRLQTLVHPLVAQNRQDFLAANAGSIVLLDIPLLFETGADALCDVIVVVSAPADVQRARVVARAEMSESDFDMILARQTPDAEKRKRADYIVETLTLDTARAAVRDIVQQLRDTHAPDRS